MKEGSILPTFYAEEIVKDLERIGGISHLFPAPPPLSPEEKERLRLAYAWMCKREEEAYTLAPWLRAEREDW